MEKNPHDRDGPRAARKGIEAAQDRRAAGGHRRDFRGAGAWRPVGERRIPRRQESFIEGRIQELESVVSRAEIIDVQSLSGETVKFGATVTVIDEENEE